MKVGLSCFKKVHESLAKQMPRVLGRTVCRVGARRLLNKALQMHKEHAGYLLNSIRSIKSIQITQTEDFGKGCHSMSSEPYVYDSAYQPVKRVTPIPINEAGQCVIASEMHTEIEGTHTNRINWQCSSECKPTSDEEVDAILALKAAFESSIEHRHQGQTGQWCSWYCSALEHVIVQFDHMNEPYNVEMVESRFMVMKNFYVYRKLFH